MNVSIDYTYFSITYSGATITSVDESTDGGTTWFSLRSGVSLASVTVFPNLTVATMYRVNGTTYGPYTLANSTGDPHLYGAILTSAVDPTKQVGLGGIDNWDVTQWQMQEDVQSYVPMGAKQEISIFGLTKMWFNTQHQYFIPGWIPGSRGEDIFATDVIRTMDLIAGLHGVALYRDRTGLKIYVTFRSYKREAYEDIHYQIYFEARETVPPQSPLVAA